MTTVVLNTTTRKVEVFSSARDVLARAYGHDSRTTLGSAIVPVGIEHVFLRGYAQAGDGGAAHYKRVASEPAHAGKIQSNDGAWWEIAEAELSMKMFGAVGDGTANDTTAMNDAVETSSAKGGGIVRVPSGEYLVNLGIELFTGVHVRGDGPEATTIKRMNSTNPGMHCIAINGGTDFSIRDLTINGNRANQSFPGHGILLTGDTGEFYIGNVRIIDAHGYGIGLQGEVSHKRGVIENILIERPGANGIDIKNRVSANEAISISNVTVIDAGMTDVDKAGVTVRGPTHLDNITVLFRTVTNNTDGIRLKFGTELDANGLGGRNCTLHNFYIHADASLAATIGVGLSIGQSGGMVSNGHIAGMAGGVISWVDSKECTVSGVTVRDCGYGFQDQTADNAWLGCKAFDCTSEGFYANGSTGSHMIGCHATGNGIGFRMGNSPVGTTLIGCKSDGNSSAWSNIGAATHVIGMTGYQFITPLTNGLGVKQAELMNSAVSDNVLRFTAVATGNAPDLSAAGVDTNIDLTLKPKGTGKVRFGNYAALGAETVTGYIEIKDGGGTVRKVAVVS